jgi:hypothetical protein
MAKRKQLTALEQLQLAKEIELKAKEALLFRDKLNRPFARYQGKDTQGMPCIELVDGHGCLISLETMERLVMFFKKHAKG